MLLKTQTDNCGGVFLLVQNVRLPSAFVGGLNEFRTKVLMDKRPQWFFAGTVTFCTYTGSDTVLIQRPHYTTCNICKVPRPAIPILGYPGVIPLATSTLM